MLWRMLSSTCSFLNESHCECVGCKKCLLTQQSAFASENNSFTGEYLIISCKCIDNPDTLTTHNDSYFILFYHVCVFVCLTWQVNKGVTVVDLLSFANELETEADHLVSKTTLPKSSLSIKWKYRHSLRICTYWTCPGCSKSTLTSHLCS